jgi:hypothetical protein
MGKEFKDCPSEVYSSLLDHGGSEDDEHYLRHSMYHQAVSTLKEGKITLEEFKHFIGREESIRSHFNQTLSACSSSNGNTPQVQYYFYVLNFCFIFMF